MLTLQMRASKHPAGTSSTNAYGSSSYLLEDEMCQVIRYPTDRSPSTRTTRYKLSFVELQEHGKLTRSRALSVNPNVMNML